MVARLPGDAGRRPGALRARPVRRLPRHRRRRRRLDDRDVRGAAPRDRQLALVGRAVLHPHRQAPAGHADRAAARLQAARRGSGFARSARTPEPDQLVDQARPVDRHPAARSTPSAADAAEPEQITLDMEFAGEGGEGADARTRCCCTPRWSATARASPARTASRRRGGSCSRCSTRRRRCTPTRRARGARPAADELVAGHGALARARGWRHERHRRQPSGRRAPERRGAVAVPADRRLRVPVRLPHRRARRARRLDRLAVRAALRLAERVRQRCSTARPASFRFGPFGINHPTARAYEPGTNVLVTTWKTPTGWVVVRDALTMGPRRDEDTITPHTRPPADDDAEHMLVRTVECIDGQRRGRAGLRAGLRLRPRARRVDAGRRRAGTPPTRPARARRSGCSTDMALGIEGDRVRARHVARGGRAGCYCALSWAEGLAAPGRRRRGRRAARRDRALLARLARPRARSPTTAGATRSSARRSRSRA